MLSPKGLFLAFAEELNIEIDQDVGHHRLLKAITERLVEFSAIGKQVVLFIDEAHAIPEQTLEALRLLTNIETETAKLFQVVLFAQPELDVALGQPSLRQLRQRITFSFEIEVLDRDGLDRYVSHRISTAGYNGPSLFSKRALDYLYRTSHGVPRIINILCHKALMAGFGKGDHSIGIRPITSGWRQMTRKGWNCLRPIIAPPILRWQVLPRVPPRSCFISGACRCESGQ